MSDEAPIKFIKKRKGAPTGLRQKEAVASTSTAAAPSTSTANGEGEAPVESEVIHATKRHLTSHLVQGTAGAIRKRKEKDAFADLSDEDEEAAEAERTRQTVGVRYSATTKRERRRSSSPPAEVSAELIKLQQQSKGKDGDRSARDVPDDGLYRGAKATQHQVTKSFGPIKGGPDNVRQITLVDYQPDVCKDYKETGFCGFGDSCKFLHDRGDYLHGWQLDNSFLSSSAAAGSFLSKQHARDNPDENDEQEPVDDLPFACLICRQPFGKDPVVTLCGHYFDAACAIKRFAKTGKCFACGTSTNGVFNRATKLIDKIKEREKLLEEAKEQEKEFEDDEGGIEIEGLEEEAGGASRARQEKEEEEVYEDEEPRPAKKRRPIIQIM
ncbi:BQ5605_C010g05880 [Microbotryum silenes-dioicae]|uniref:Pre-mRNA-splicing factor CWC24 n=1 Tax=Microbotryum silenes-dioicae TaxID=796604 RepID=A0A2X0LPX0_9BASI|nr:BQ5605_C010g05880 [Microbotryum silenes-dioicae]